jgi:uncharacterized protein (DUF1778 family)
MVERSRERMVNVRMTDDEADMLKALAEHEGLSASDIVRQYIRRAFAKAFPQAKPKR